MEYKEEDYLMLSGIQHFAFCRRQWALIHIERVWEENLRTVEGSLMHERCHDTYLSECRGEVILSRAMPVFSASMGVSGACDVVEFHKSAQGISLPGRKGCYKGKRRGTGGGRVMKKLLNTLYITTENAYLTLDGENVVATADGAQIGRLPLHIVDSIVSFGYVGASPALMGKCADMNIALVFLKPSG